MKLLATNGKLHAIDIRPSKWPRRSEADCKSHLQWTVSQALDKLYPQDVVLEEFHIPGESLYIDFFLPRKRLVVEVHGAQHYCYSEFFHGSKEAFQQSKLRDKRKRDWCELNNITFVEIRYDDDEEEVLNKLKLTYE